MVKQQANTRANIYQDLSKGCLYSGGRKSLSYLIFHFIAPGFDCVFMRLGTIALPVPQWVLLRGVADIDDVVGSVVLSVCNVTHLQKYTRLCSFADIILS